MNDLGSFNNFIVSFFSFVSSYSQKNSKAGVVKCFLCPGLSSDDINESVFCSRAHDILLMVT